MPELIALYDAHAADRDRFQIFAIHDKTVHSFDELDKKLVPLKKRYWQDKDLPFPILLDATGKTEATYAIHAHPTGLLIDPDGKLVGEASPNDLEAKLPPLPASKQWARHRDMQKNVVWSFEPKTYTLNKLAETLTRWGRPGCPVEVDVEAVKASGLTPDGPLPGVVFGGPITLRSLEHLLLAPHGLGVVASPDDKKLLISRRRAEAEDESYLQKLHAKDIADRLDHLSADGGASAKPLEIKDQPLLDALRLFEREFDLPFALDAHALHTRTLDPDAKISGTLDPRKLRQSLAGILAPHGLTVEVRDEVVFVTPRAK
jgi:hypothetical protein